MRLVRRWLLNILSALSLLLAVATIGLWVWSYLRPQTFVWEHCDALWAPLPEQTDDVDMGRPEGPTADQSIEFTLIRGHLRLWRERMLGTARQIAWDADGKPVRISVPGWHLVGKFVGSAAGRDRWVGVFIPHQSYGGVQVPGWSELWDYPRAALEINTGFETEDDSPAGQSGPPFETYADIALRLWLLLALTLIFPGWWFVGRNVVSRRRRRSEANSRASGVRRTVLIASMISLFLCLTAVTLWITSRWQQSELNCSTEWTRGQRTIAPQLVVDCTSGELRILAALDNYPRGEGHTKLFHQLADTTNDFQLISWSPPDSGSPEWQWRGTGFGWHTEYYPRDPDTHKEGRAWWILAPLWFVVFLLAILPAHTVVRIAHLRRERLRLARNLCPSCGYDLRASSLRCPECGWPVSTRVGDTT